MNKLLLSKTTAFFAIICLWVTNSAIADGIPANLNVSYDFTKNISVLIGTTTKSKATTEFEIDLTSTILKMDNYLSYGYCVELAQGISQKNYLFNIFELKDDKYFKAAWVMEQFAPGRPDLWTDDLKYQAAAVQGLIWELTGNISAVSNKTFGAIYNKYTSYKTQLGAVNWEGEEGEALKYYLNSNYMFAKNAQFQDLLVKVDPVPEPATLLLFGSGMLGLTGLRFRRKAQAN